MKELELRDLFNGNFYHVCTNGLEELVLLRDDEDYRTAWNYLALCSWRCGIFIVAFILMSNHVHALTACQNADQVNRFIKLYKHLISKHLFNKYGMRQTLHNTPDCISQIDSVQYLKNCIAYILRNAISAKICVKIEDYMWSSYRYYFLEKGNMNSSKPVSSLSFRKKRSILKTDMDLSECPLTIDQNGMIDPTSFLRTDIAEKAYWNSGKSFLLYLGSCNDSKMEYELACQPLLQISDIDLYEYIKRYISARFNGKELSELTTSEKCSVLKKIYFNFKTSIPQLSRIFGLPRHIIQKIMST